MDSDYRASPLSRDDICHETQKLRNSLGISQCKAVPIVKVIEYGLPEVIDGFNYEIVDDDDLPGREAETYPMECKIAISQSTYTKACHDDPHARFTLAHEMGHLFLHTPQTLSLAQEKDSAGELRIYEKPGWQADAFAGEFLAPMGLIRGLGVEEIESLFIVSRAVAMRQFDLAAQKSWFGHCGQSGQPWLPGMEPLGTCWRSRRTFSGGRPMA